MNLHNSPSERNACYQNGTTRSPRRCKVVFGRSLIWSNLCTRHIPEKLTPRGHHDWPDKRRSVYRLRSDRRPLVQSSCSRGPRVTWTRPPPYPYQILTAGSAPWVVGRRLG